jgi:hypothetical protein
MKLLDVEVELVTIADKCDETGLLHLPIFGHLVNQATEAGNWDVVREPGEGELVSGPGQPFLTCENNKC